jgi:hypothetical protein
MLVTMTPQGPCSEVPLKHADVVTAPLRDLSDPFRKQIWVEESFKPGTIGSLKKENAEVEVEVVDRRIGGQDPDSLVWTDERSRASVWHSVGVHAVCKQENATRPDRPDIGMVSRWQIPHAVAHQFTCALRTDRHVLSEPSIHRQDRAPRAACECFTDEAVPDDRAMSLDPAKLVGLLRGLLADEARERWASAGAVTDLRTDMSAAESRMIATVLAGVAVWETDGVAREAELHALAELHEWDTTTADAAHLLRRLDRSTLAGSEIEYVAYLDGETSG